MVAKTRTAFFYAVALHIAAIVAIALVVLLVRTQTKPPQGIFELVAGPGNDLTATQAPAKGTQDGDTVELKLPPAPPAPRHRERIAPAPARPEAVPVPRQAEAVPVPRQPEARPPVTRTREETKPAVRERAPAEHEQRMSYEEYVKRFGAPKAPSASESRVRRPIRAPRIDVRGIADGVLRGAASSRAGSGGTALTATEHSALEGYIARLIVALRQNHEKPPGLSDLLSADVRFHIAADGTITDVRIVRSSGNEAFDQSCLEAFRRLGSIGPKPDGKPDTWTITFRMKDE